MKQRSEELKKEIEKERTEEWIKKWKKKDRNNRIMTERMNEWKNK